MQYSFQYILTGDSGVGKSCLLRKFTHDRFVDNHSVTVGLEFASKTLAKENELPVKLKIWDTSGQERFRSLTRNYYKGAAVALLVFDVTNRESFENIPMWITEVQEHAMECLQVVIVGNKIDLDRKRMVTRQEGLAVAKMFDALYVETSCKCESGQDPTSGIHKAFWEPAKILLEKLASGEIDFEKEQAKGKSIGIQVVDTTPESSVLQKALGKSRMCC